MLSLSKEHQKIIVYILCVLNMGIFTYFQFVFPQSSSEDYAQSELSPNKFELISGKFLDKSSNKVSTKEPSPVYSPIMSVAKIENNVPYSPSSITLIKDAVIPQQVSDGISCYKWGSFNASQIIRLKKYLYKFKLELPSHSIKLIVDTQPLYWVYLPPKESMDATQKQLKALKNRGVKNGSILTEGKGKGSISFGLFKEENHANLVLERLQKSGISNVKKSITTRPQYFLLLHITDKMRERFIKDFQDSLMIKTECPIE